MLLIVGGVVVLPKAADTLPTVCNPGKFRTLFTSFASIHALIVQSVEAKHWDAVSYLVKTDIDGWVMAVVAHDQLKPFSTLMVALADEPHPLSSDLQMIVSITVVGLTSIQRWKAPGHASDLEPCVATGVPLIVHGRDPACVHTGRDHEPSG